MVWFRLICISRTTAAGLDVNSASKVTHYKLEPSQASERSAQSGSSLLQRHSEMPCAHRDDLAAVLLRDLVDQRRDHAARPAPGCPEVHQHRHLALQHQFLPCRVRHRPCNACRDGSHVSLLAKQYRHRAPQITFPGTCSGPRRLKPGGRMVSHKSAVCASAQSCAHEHTANQASRSCTSEAAAALKRPRCCKAASRT